MNGETILNCSNCMFSNFVDGGKAVECDKRLLWDGKLVRREKEWVERHCVAHSDRFMEETRIYFSNEDMRDSETSCGVCGRLVDLKNEGDYKYVVMDGGERVYCRICKEKGRS